MGLSGRPISVLLLSLAIAIGDCTSLLAGEPLELVKTAVERGIQVLKNPQLKSPDQKKERVNRLREIINPIFDCEEMARRTMGSHWRRLTSAEQQEFYSLFRGFLEKIYSDKLEFFDSQRVIFGRETIDQDYAQVESTAIDAKGVDSPIVYRLKRTDGKWKVYDAIVENISIVNNYRSQFDRVISKSSFDDLRKMLKEKAE